MITAIATVDAASKPPGPIIPRHLNLLKKSNNNQRYMKNEYFTKYFDNLMVFGNSFQILNAINKNILLKHSPRNTRMSTKKSYTYLYMSINNSGVITKNCMSLAKYHDTATH